MNETSVKIDLEKWLIDNTRIEGLNTIPTDLDLITNRVVDSLKFVDLILLVEELSGQSIEMESIELKQLESIDAIWKYFFA